MKLRRNFVAFVRSASGNTRCGIISIFLLGFMHYVLIQYQLRRWRYSSGASNKVDKIDKSIQTHINAHKHAYMDHNNLSSLSGGKLHSENILGINMNDQIKPNETELHMRNEIHDFLQNRSKWTGDESKSFSDIVSKHARRSKMYPASRNWSPKSDNVRKIVFRKSKKASINSLKLTMLLRKSEHGDKILNWEAFSRNAVRNISCSSKHFIRNKFRIINFKEKFNCQPHISPPEACKYAESLYLIDPTLYKCKNNGVTTDICKVIRNNNEEHYYYEIRCSIPAECHHPDSEPTFYAIGLNKKTGRLQRKGIYYSMEELEEKLPRHIRKAERDKSHFLFLDCKLVSSSTNGTNPSQLLYFAPTARPSVEFARSVRKLKTKHLGTNVVNKTLQSSKNESYKLVKSLHTSKLENKIPQSSTKQRNKISRPHINVNMVLLDSVSRAHFYRSLPSTIAAFSDINSNKTTEAEVLDFELFQSVHGHSAENIHALFSGSLNPDNMTDDEREKIAVGVNNLYGKFKQAGYHTVYQDDLCWAQWWGMRMDLGSPKTWKKFLNEIKNSFIDDTGMLCIN